MNNKRAKEYIGQFYGELDLGDSDDANEEMLFC